MKLVIVESSAKIKSIEKFLGKDYKVIASTGHIRELKKKPGYGFNRETLEPQWEIVAKSKNLDKLEETIDSIKKFANQADEIYLATDPDREGESISWHIYDILDKKSKDKCKRITFNEITKNAITNAINEPRDIDMNLVESQFGRRYLDRIVGYDLSNLVKSKLHATSAGRVQSVALLFIVERWKEVQNFKPRFWWTIDGELENNKKGIKVWLRKISEDLNIKQFEDEESENDREFRFISEEDAATILNKLGKEFRVYAIDDPTTFSAKSYVPFTTDSLLTTAFNKLGWSTSKTTKLANELYSGVEIDGQMTALISYPRTDTNRLNDGFIADLRQYIKKEFGEEYVNHNVREARSGNLVQGAHEGIRPIDISIDPSSLDGKIKTKNPKESKDALILYNLIWNYTVASFMNSPKYKRFVVRFENNGQKFYTTYNRLLFKGYYILPYWEKKNQDSDIDLSNLKINDILYAKAPFEIIKHQTEPPSLYNEGSLVKALKDEGVGRPSTYGTMIKIVKDRGYVEQKNKKLEPTEKGVLLIDNLVKECSDVISKKYTAQMELELDAIAEGKENWKEWFRAFYEKFKLILSNAKQNMQKVAPKIFTDHVCPKCGSALVYKEKRSDKTQFLGCSNYNRDGGGCSYTESLEVKEKPKPELIDEKCPICGKQLIKRYNKRGQPFKACTGFFETGCKFIASYNSKETNLKNKN